MNTIPTSINRSIIVMIIFLLSGCAIGNPPATNEGTSWGQGVFTSNGEQIYFTATSDRGTDITYTAGPSSTGWMMTGGQLTCASSHGTDGKGGIHRMGLMEAMKAPEIRCCTLENDFNAASFKLEV